MNPEVVTLGETMALLTGSRIGPLRLAHQLDVSIGGAESNVAIGLARLGHRVAWTGRIGGDEFGELIRRTLTAEGIDISAAIVDPYAPTGLMVKSRRTSRLTSVTYYRAHSAASRLEPADVPVDKIASARLLHVTGITPALSPTAAAAVTHAIDVAAKSGVTVALDVNYRRALWSPSDAGPVLARLVEQANIVFASDHEAALVCAGSDEPAALAAELAARGASEAVIKLGARGAVACIDGQPHAVGAYPADEVDPVGAGDAFVAAYLSGYLRGLPPAARLDLAARAGAIAVSAHGDWEGVAYADELDSDATDNVTR